MLPLSPSAYTIVPQPCLSGNIGECGDINGDVVSVQTDSLITWTPSRQEELDEQFATKNKDLQAKLDKATRFEPRTFFVSTSGFDSFLKQHSESMVAKKANPTPIPSPVSAETKQ